MDGVGGLIGEKLVWKNHDEMDECSLVYIIPLCIFDTQLLVLLIISGDKEWGDVLPPLILS